MMEKAPDLITKAVEHLNKMFTYDPMAYYFRAEEGTAVIGPQDIRRWEFFGDHHLALTLKNSKIIHLTYETEAERERQMYSALEWWAK